MKSIAVVTLLRPDGQTGVQSNAKRLLAGFRARDLDVRLMTPFDGWKSWSPVFAVRPLLLSRINPTWSTKWHRYWHFHALRGTLIRHLRSKQYDVLLAQCPLSAKAALDARRVTNTSSQVVLVCRFNFSEADEYVGKGVLSDPRDIKDILDLEEDVIRSVDKVIYVSEWLKQSIEITRGIQPKSSRVIWNGYPIGEPGTQVTRSSLGFSDEDFLFVNVGTLEPRKNQLGLLEMFKQVVQRHEHAHLLLVGSGPDQAKIIRRAQSLGIQDRVHLLGVRGDVVSLLRACDLYIHYAEVESFGVVLLEAAAAGLPIACVPAGGSVEVLHALGGVVELDPGDIQGSVERLELLLSDVDLRHRFGEKNRSNLELNISMERTVKEYLQFLGF